GYYSLASRLTGHAWRLRVDDFAILNPNVSFGGAIGYLEDRRTLRQTFQLDNIDQAFALHAAEASFLLPAEQGLDGLHKQTHFLVRLRLDPILIDAHGVGAGAELLLADAGKNDQAQLRIFAPGNREHLQAVHFRHVQVHDQQVELFRLQQRQRARPRRS